MANTYNPRYSILRDLYATNPHDQKAQAVATVAQNSGYARPILNLVLGQEIAASGEYNKRADEARMNFLRDSQSREAAQKVLQQAIELSKTDPLAANDILQAESKVNPYLSNFSNIKFSGKTKDNYITYTNTKTGETGMFNLFEFNEYVRKAHMEGRELTKEDMNSIIDEVKIPLSKGLSPAELGKGKTGGLTKEKILKEYRMVNTAIANAAAKFGLTEAFILSSNNANLTKRLKEMGFDKSNAEEILKLKNARKEWEKEYRRLTGRDIGQETTSKKEKPTASKAKNNAVHQYTRSQILQEIKRRQEAKKNKSKNKGMPTIMRPPEL